MEKESQLIIKEKDYNTPAAQEDIRRRGEKVKKEKKASDAVPPTVTQTFQQKEFTI